LTLFLSASDIEHRSTRSVPRRSRTLAFGFDTIRDLEHTICTKSTAKCRGPMPWKLSTKTWLPVTARDSGPFMYAYSSNRGKVCINPPTDPQGRRDREDRRCQAPIHQATSPEGPEVPSASPRSQGKQQKAICSSPPIYVCIEERRGLIHESWVMGVILGAYNCRHDQWESNKTYVSSASVTVRYA
jgi:hypothetical protein